MQRILETALSQSAFVSKRKEKKQRRRYKSKEGGEWGIEKEEEYKRKGSALK